MLPYVKLAKLDEKMTIKFKEKTPRGHTPQISTLQDTPIYSPATLKAGLTGGNSASVMGF